MGAIAPLTNALMRRAQNRQWARCRETLETDQESAAFSAVASSAAFIFFRSTVILSIFPVHLLSPFS
jgi:hypothetical protein